MYQISVQSKIFSKTLLSIFLITGLAALGAADVYADDVDAEQIEVITPENEEIVTWAEDHDNGIYEKEVRFEVPEDVDVDSAEAAIEITNRDFMLGYYLELYVGGEPQEYEVLEFTVDGEEPDDFAEYVGEDITFEIEVDDSILSSGFSYDDESTLDDFYEYTEEYGEEEGQQEEQAFASTFFYFDDEKYSTGSSDDIGNYNLVGFTDEIFDVPDEPPREEPMSWQEYQLLYGEDEQEELQDRQEQQESGAVNHITGQFGKAIQSLFSLLPF